MQPIASAIASVRLGLESSFAGLTMFPLLEREPEPEPVEPIEPVEPEPVEPEPVEPEPVEPVEPVEPDYLILDDALALGWTEITEVSAAGSVPELAVVNRAARPVLIVDGEELVGARQNRIVNLTILVPAQAKLVIPVTCVEAGRWTARSRAFGAAPRAHYVTGRARKTRQVTESMLHRAERRADQLDCWTDIARTSERLDAESATGAASAIYERHAASLEEYVRALAPVERQRGALFAIGERVAGVDLFDSAVTCRKLLHKLVRSYAVGALDVPREGGAAPRARERSSAAAASLRAAAGLFLRVLGECEGQSLPALGLGEDVRLSGPSLHGAALVHGGAVVHLCAFAE